jgi:hypothetical protein
MKTAQQAQANWTGAASRATPAFVQGVQQTQKDQAALAVQQQAALLANFTQSVLDGRWAQGVTRRGTAYWKSQTEAKSTNYTQGYTAGANNYQAAAAKFMPAIAQGVASLPPRGDINQNLQRSNSLALYLHGLKGQLGA